ncbi:MAG: PfkB family carbohydrate kinase [Chloroflexota bacterium]|nr:PfkB family carbohydrate kinase [Chloroflexota bacterium]
MPSEVMVAGHIALDILPDMSALKPEEVIGAGKVFEIGPISYSTGGAVSNTGLALRRLGIDVDLLAVVGADWVGRAIIDYVRGYDSALGDHIRVLPDAASAYTIVIEPRNHDRTLLTHTGVYQGFGLDNIDLDLAAGCKLFHLGYPTLLPRLYADDGDGFLELAQTIKDLGPVTSVDMSLPAPDSPSGQADWRGILRRCLPFVDIFVPSIEEIMFMLRRADHDRWGGEIIARMTADYLADLAGELLGMGPGIVGFKLGERGLYLAASANRARLEFLSRIGQAPADWLGIETWHPPFQVRVAGTTGAGDAAYAGLIAALIRGLDYQDCARWACAVAACNIEAADATSGVRAWEETAARLSGDWPAGAL